MMRGNDKRENWQVARRRMASEEKGKKEEERRRGREDIRKRK